MQTNDYHQRYFHPHYLLAAKLYVQSDGSILVLTGNIKLELTPGEVHTFLDGILEYASMFTGLRNETTAIEAHEKKPVTERG